MTDPTFPEVFAAITSEHGIEPELVERVFAAILEGHWTPVQVAGFAVALRLTGENAPVIAAAARAMRSAMIPVRHRYDDVLDTCGTGGDGAGTLNLSTGAAILCASTGIKVAKHGNRAVSSRSGSADVLEALGVPTDLPAEAASEILDEIGIAFLMAPTHHPAMRHGGVARRELGIRTVFNCLGPLANPALATHQLLGCYDHGVRRMMAETLRQLGTKRAWVVRSSDDLDEVSPYATTRVSELSSGRVTEIEIHPSDFGIATSAEGAIRGGDAAENARVIERVLAGEPHPARDAFVLNAAAALVVMDADLPPKRAAERVTEVLEGGKARALLDSWRAAAQSRKKS
jgi:anthranilate phosphoribosyltransferase